MPVAGLQSCWYDKSRIIRGCLMATFATILTQLIEENGITEDNISWRDGYAEPKPTGARWPSGFGVQSAPLGLKRTGESYSQGGALGFTRAPSWGLWI
jgi:hypothetical protein